MSHLGPRVILLLMRFKVVLLLWIICVIMSCHAFASVHCCLVVTCPERADLLALVCNVKLYFCHFPCGILGLVRYSIVLIPVLCPHSYLKSKTLAKSKNVLKGILTHLAYIANG